MRRDEVYPALSKPDLDEVRSTMRELSDLAVWRSWPVTLTPPDGEPTRVQAASIDSRFFALLGVTPVVGRSFTPDDDVPGHEPVVILSHAYWRRAYGSDPSVIGTSVELDGNRFTIVGVTPVGFRDPLAAAWRGWRC